MGRYKDANNRLFETASDQAGFFTAKQAIAAGYADNTHPFHVRAGNWVREHRGIYRLARYPLSERYDLVLWHLWSRGRGDEPQGTYSHETALSLYELSDVNPARLHMTVPPAFRRSAPTPKILILHHGIIRDDERTQMQGFRVTTPLKTLADLLRTRTVSMDHLAQAVTQAFHRGLITEKQLVRSRIPEEFKKEIRGLRSAHDG